MGWLYVPGMVGSSLDSSPHWGADVTAPWVTSSETPTQRPSSWPGWKTRPWIARLSGTICAPSTANRGADAWILLLRDSRVSRSALPLEAGGLPQTSGLQCAAQSSGLTPRSPFWKTSPRPQYPLPPVISQRLATALGCFNSGPPSWVPRTNGQDGGYLPTITTRRNQGSDSMQKWPAYRRLRELTGRRCPVAFWEWMMGLPVGWTGCGALGMEWSHPSQPQHSVHSQDEGEGDGLRR